MYIQRYIARWYLVFSFLVYNFDYDEQVDYV